MITTKGDNYECTEKSLFIKLFVEHIEISLIAILIADRPLEESLES